MTKRSTTAISGHIDDVDPRRGARIVVNFDGRSVTYGFGELDMLVPAYAATIHKSQGSEYPAVIIPVLTQHYAMFAAEIFLYTGVHQRQAAGRAGGAEERPWPSRLRNASGPAAVVGFRGRPVSASHHFYRKAELFDRLLAFDVQDRPVGRGPALKTAAQRCPVTLPESDEAFAGARLD